MKRLFRLDPAGPQEVTMSNDVYYHLAYEEDYLDDSSADEERELLRKFPEGFEVIDAEAIDNGLMRVTIHEYTAPLPRGNYKVLIPDETLYLAIQTLPEDQNLTPAAGVPAEVCFVMPKQNRVFGQEQVVIQLNKANKPVVKLKSGTEVPVWGPRLVHE